MPEHRSPPAAVHRVEGTLAIDPISAKKTARNKSIQSLSRTRLATTRHCSDHLHKPTALAVQTTIGPLNSASKSTRTPRCPAALTSLATVRWNTQVVADAAKQRTGGHPPSGDSALTAKAAEQRIGGGGRTPAPQNVAEFHPPSQWSLAALGSASSRVETRASTRRTRAAPRRVAPRLWSCRRADIDRLSPVRPPPHEIFFTFMKSSSKFNRYPASIVSRDVGAGPQRTWLSGRGCTEQVEVLATLANYRPPPERDLPWQFDPLK